MAADKPLPLPARPLFRPAAPRIHTLANPDAVKAAARAAVAGEVQADKQGIAEKILAEEAAKRVADEQARFVKLAQVIGASVTAGHREVMERISDDFYNAAILTNPHAFAVMQGREGLVSIPDQTKTVRVYANKFLVPVVVVGRADNDPANDVQSVHLSGGETLTKETHAHQNDGTFSALLRPGQSLFAGVRAITAGAVNLVFAVIPLRGRASVFGG